jgi:hypothetical protein
VVTTARPSAPHAFEWREGALPPENPTTSQGIGVPGVSITRRAPTDIACNGPATSTISPRTADDAAVDHDAVEFADLLGEGLHAANRRRTIRATMVTS